MRRFMLTIVLLLLSVPVLGRDAAEIQLALRRLTSVGGALYVAAHPDDENTAMLSWLASERNLRTAYLSITRGDGGQNLIGDETGPLLGVIRTQELLAARRIDGAEQFFTRAIDFGYSKSPQETLSIWNEEKVLEDVVWIIRRFQPDVIVMRFPTTGEGGHGQHTASAILAEKAFSAAGDASVFPEQLRFVSPWRARRIFWNRFSWRPVDPNDPSLAGALRVDLGTYNPLLGRAYTEIAAVSRSQHKSQGFGSAERRGSVINYYTQTGGEPATADLFEGIDTRWSRYPRGETVGRLLEQAADTFDSKNPSASLPLLLEALRALDRLRAYPEWSPAQKPWLETRRQDLMDVIRDCAGIAIDVSAARSAVTPGSDLPMTVTVVNRSNHPFRLAMVASVLANPGKAPGTLLENNKPVTTEVSFRIPLDTPTSQPYWLRYPPARGLYAVPNPLNIGRPENLPELAVNVTLDDAMGNVLIFTVPVTWRQTDPVAGELVRKVDVVTPVSLKMGSAVYIFPEAKARPVTVWMRSYQAAKGSVKLKVPEPWKVEPSSVPVTFDAAGDERTATFTVTPPAVDSVAAMLAELTLEDGRTVSEGIADIEYPHIAPQRVFGESVAKVVRADIRRRGDRIGYIMGSGDDVPEILRQVGYDVVLLTDADLDRGDFSRFDAIVAGIRAYNTRERLRLAHGKLMEWVAAGGTMVVQYNTTGDLVVAEPGPYPFKISRDRVTVEEAPVRLLAPDHPVLRAPNRITSADFAGWIQERGLYFPGEWDAAYVPLLGSNDPGESEKEGGLLFARHGKGAFVYTGYAWWRQLPAGVPGAIRTFVNLVSAE
jgi:LmbE family N-acetylglucosaminyl deacetylase